MLIDSPRLTRADRAAWARLEHYDDVLSHDPRLTTLEWAGIKAVEEFVEAGECYLSTSWGKDSVAMLHLALKAAPCLVLRSVRVRDFTPPETDLVRDAFLASHPAARYEEVEAVMRVPMRGEPGYEAQDHTQDVLAEELSGRYVSGVRGEESRIRGISIAHRGLVTKNTCRPLGRWSAVQVFAYLHREQLPVHPAYAMSVAGRHDRRWLRVHTLGCAPPSRSGVMRGYTTEEWEDRYFGDVLAAARAARAGMWAAA